jgi:hypothetical protein
MRPRFDEISQVLSRDVDRVHCDGMVSDENLIWSGLTQGRISHFEFRAYGIEIGCFVRHDGCVEYDRLRKL